jgi:hypothetical protein
MFGEEYTGWLADYVLQTPEILFLAMFFLVRCAM